MDVFINFFVTYLAMCHIRIDIRHVRLHVTASMFYRYIRYIQVLVQTYVMSSGLFLKPELLR